jgi:hypothetical protein
LAFLAHVAEKHAPITNVVCIGDSLDMHRLSRFAPEPDSAGANDEHKAGLAFLKELYALFPVCVEVASNHNARYLHRARDAGLPSSFLRSYADIMESPPGWNLVAYHEIDGVMYEHGDRFGGQSAQRQAMYINGQSTVFGHHHSHAGIQWMQNRKSARWAMNVGCLIDRFSYGLAYAAVSRFYQTLGTGVVLGGVPYWEPMFVDSDNRWVGAERTARPKTKGKR